MTQPSGWIGVDLDGCLAEYHGWPKDGGIGKPVPKMLERVKAWLSDGWQVKIFTARVCWINSRSAESGEIADGKFARKQEDLIKAWCLQFIGQELEVTCIKDFAMVELWDDRCVQIIPNTGERADGK